ncbi:hypothetical protein C5750_20095 [Phyllobacterium myrsinacearum]|jgi:hypothetical protein|uniref:Uncharacterized protein n=1 Tax=Phyllobacterium myrsinacearum TaxID=28101 RepID=A0A2S9JE19_9HYPH|nr:hypothetical protein C5750_20095 [Phyllobacterium myrsinacearum]
MRDISIDASMNEMCKGATGSICLRIAGELVEGRTTIMHLKDTGKCLLPALAVTAAIPSPNIGNSVA